MSYAPLGPTVPLPGVGPCQVVLATRAGERGRLVTAFRECARSHLAGPANLQPDG